ncbi:ISAs1 family transposase [Bowmanella denitrificans]|uniref:ISAs1 family transposase n=1 Tax=Bowmanella denitrificans TaxID=366582 RepID=UPI000C9998E2|nr:ISAs1 family transposase [Bowmanella denitrificans]
MKLGAFEQHFENLQDPRQTAKVTHLFSDILFLLVCASIAGLDGWEDIEDFGEMHFDWFRSKGLFKNGLPVHDTIARVVSSIDPEQFTACFINWMKSVVELSDGQLIAIDGKRLRSSYPREDRKSTIHMVNAFATQNALVLGQVKTEDKSNEITAIPELLKLLDIKGCLVSIDAMGCQTDIAQRIVDKGGDYLLAVKGNQEQLHEAVKRALLPYTDTAIVCLEQGHGRFEARAYHVMDVAPLAPQFVDWPELKTLGVAMGYRREPSGQDSLEFRYYISSAKLTKTKFAEAVRGHWGIENCLHWVLDVAMNEDRCGIYRGHAAQILACFRQVGLNMLRKEQSKKLSIPRKQRRATVRTDYLERVLVAGMGEVLEK